MKLFVTRNSYFFLFLLIFIVAEFIVNPLGNFPLNDDWCYAQSVKMFYRTEGQMFLNNWPAMTLFSQVVWGFLFSKVFGFSCFILRFSTIVSALIGFSFLNRLLVQINGNRLLAFAGCIILLFNPLYFNLTNTFMTDVSFNTLVIISFYFMYNFFGTKKLAYYAGFVVFSVILVLLRQYGIIFPACFLLACFFVKERKIQNLILGVISIAAVIGSLKLYENYLSPMMAIPDVMYKFSGNIHPMERIFWDNFFEAFSCRYQKSLIQVFTYAMPFLVIFIAPAIRQLRTKMVLGLLLLDALIMYGLYDTAALDTGNVLVNMRLGPELFYESFQGAVHNHSETYGVVWNMVRLVSAFIGLFVFSLFLAGFTVTKAWRRFLQPRIVFFIAFILGYIVMLLITVSYHDRYHIPFITGIIVMTSYLTTRYKPGVRMAVIPVLFWAWVSVAGTKDYLEWNRQRWNAYWYLRTELKVPMVRINGGFEVNCWAESGGWGWRDFLNLDNFDYLIQFNPEKGFKPLKEFEFQRYFPYKKDKVYIFVKEAKQTVMPLKGTMNTNEK